MTDGDIEQILKALHQEFAEVRGIALNTANESHIMAASLFGPELHEVQGGGRDRAAGLVGRIDSLETVASDTNERMASIESMVSGIHDRATSSNGNPGVRASVTLTKTERWAVYAVVVSAVLGAIATISQAIALIS